tara:strand:+ start:8818 stop:9300 length:483 start_codon:yes stop_codon:yes gene_type:complete
MILTFIVLLTISQYSNAECLSTLKESTSDRVNIDKYGISISFDSSKKIDGSGYREVDCVDSGCSPHIKCYTDNVISKYSKWDCFPKNNGISIRLSLCDKHKYNVDKFYIEKNTINNTYSLAIVLLMLYCLFGAPDSMFYFFSGMLVGTDFDNEIIEVFPY